MSKPDFIVIGAMKCGTTTLAAQLGAQDGLFMTTPKEPNYFSDDRVFLRGPNWYAGLFAGAAQGDLKGEASTHYTKRPDYPRTLERMQKEVPQAKLVYMIRNPLARLVSHYIHEWSEGQFDSALDAVHLERHPALVDYGRFGWQIAPYIEAYGRAAILLTSLERLTRDGAGELARVAAHLGHDGPVTWQADLERENASAERVRKLPMHKLLIDHPLSARIRRTLVPKSFRQRVREARKMKQRPGLSAEMRAMLEARFLEDRALLATYFPNDPSLDLAYPFAKTAAT